ncbi:hypothetical protein Tcan_02349 [Toxocara canis]|uniref:Uncharacterized protein n=1 Tax=Toxocara canis TaxID=6265 RepID=A0A0B2UPP7_TOXCA|nr:hypothetical protein Tcan_02349 [Toxocara canis]
MSVDLLKICDPWAYYTQFLFESVYPDGRSISSFRPVSLQLPLKNALTYCSEFGVDSEIKSIPEVPITDLEGRTFIGMGITESASGSSVARQGGAMITARIEPFLGVSSDDTVIVPHIEATPVIPQRVVEDAEVLLKQLIEEEAFFKRDILLTANGRLMWILHLHILVRILSLHYVLHISWLSNC